MDNVRLCGNRWPRRIFEPTSTEVSGEQRQLESSKHKALYQILLERINEFKNVIKQPTQSSHQLEARIRPGPEMMRKKRILFQDTKKRPSNQMNYHKTKRAMLIYPREMK
jgi:hypothetical protein